MTANTNTSWSVDQAKAYYNLPYWSDGFFDLNQQGDLTVSPDKTKPELQFTLSSICQELKARGFQMPALLRFGDIIHHRVNSLCQAFNKAIDEFDYNGYYTICYPIKVNQQRRVVEEIVKSQAKIDKQQKQIGLEAGSKPELMAVLAMSENTNSTIVCNGYKDREYLRAALIGSKLGHTVYIVIEKLSELHLLLEESKVMGIKPTIGVRARLASKGESKWQTSGGDHSKFGLSASQILRLVETLIDNDQLDIFQLLHFHLGSQITSIHDIRNALKECARFFAELQQLGAPIKTVDVGGGLGVDYEGTRSQSHCSMNYSLEEYAHNVVAAFHEVSISQNLPHPNIITESGRALTAHHAVLVANVIDAESPVQHDISKPQDECATVLHNLWVTYQDSLQGDNARLIQAHHDAGYYLNEAQGMFSHQVLSLSERAIAERLHRLVLMAIKQRLQPETQEQENILAQLNEQLASKYFVNFSIFQSLPDAWAIDQIFPVMPLQGLDKEPTESAIIQDITCDSDGVLDQYVNNFGITSTIQLPQYTHGEEYLLGFFLVGAYQEILGDMHNLFGDTHTIDLRVTEQGELDIYGTDYGSGVDELLDYVDFDAKSLLESYRRQLKASNLELTQQRQYLAELREGIYGYSYLED
ncbi:biosynthetic arginine decarboxylase [Kangiella sediminilitoris]|uniref:Biosynthetic arginine decarboxylase n=1 Tax=Kangiella sediminilitoris TaxID=1144748 RepID=A0A1B3BAA6_9GAMM|nr:biosynthetic arginine decarboxylase [Kangiella sediminilitoris]AOE49760.1 Biosynthetic arginine decarboxylase [Kangiella sediminilitoris]